jgi:hypothetical protein
MTNSREQILEMVASGKISAAEGEALLEALRPKRRWSWLSDPFERLDATRALALGVAGAAAGLVLSRFHIRFDGALDVHVSRAAVTLRQALADQLVSWPLLALVLWAAARARGAHARVVDVVANAGVARLPILWVAFVVALLHDHLPTNPADRSRGALAVVLALVVFSLPAIVYAVVLFYRGFRAASGLRGERGGVAFTVGLVAAEVVAKLALKALG